MIFACLQQAIYPHPVALRLPPGFRTCPASAASRIACLELPHGLPGLEAQARACTPHPPLQCQLQQVWIWWDCNFERQVTYTRLDEPSEWGEGKLHCILCNGEPPPMRVMEPVDEAKSGC